ncbi:hypothetical protein [Pulveribacter sp.]|uniref:hypothetical protein n=1 Tax=Pulveribacter sp. TaxID=2678893 RepID=UPI0028AD0896|nr:hypothetical protein [Pulveribacter sp.]
MPRSHIRARRAGLSPVSTTVLHSQRSRSSPASQRISSRDVRMTRAARPVCASTFCDSDVRVLLWKGASVAGVSGIGRVVFMGAIVGQHAPAVHVQISESRT